MPRVCWLLFVYSLVALSFCFCFASFCCFGWLGFARAFPSRAHSPCRFLGLPLEFQSPSGPWEPALPPTSPLDFLVYPSGFVGGTPPIEGSATVVSPTLACEGGCLGVGGWALEGRRHGQTRLGFEGFGYFDCFWAFYDWKHLCLARS